MEKQNGNSTIKAYVDWCKAMNRKACKIESILEYSQIGVA